MKTFALILAAALLASPAAHATKQTAAKKPASTKKDQKKPAKVTTQRKGQVLNYSLDGTPFYSSHRVFSMH